MTRFAWIAVLSGVALIAFGCSGEKPAPQADTPATDAPADDAAPMDINVDINVPDPAVPTDVQKPTEVEPMPAATPAAKPDAAANADKPKVRKAVGKALLKAVTGSVGKPAESAPAFKQ